MSKYPLQWNHEKKTKQTIAHVENVLIELLCISIDSLSFLFHTHEIRKCNPYACAAKMLSRHAFLHVLFLLLSPVLFDKLNVRHLY